MQKPAGLVAGMLLAICVCSAAAAAGAGQAAAKQLSGLIRVSVKGATRSVPPTLLGLNGVDTTGPAWDDPAFDVALGKFSPGVIRYPGGAAANYWSWPDGWFQPGSWPGEPSRRVNDRLPVFTLGLRAARALPLFDLNTVTYHGAIASAADNAALLHQQLQLLHAASAAGLPVRRVELGNELYQNGNSSTSRRHSHDYVKRFPTAADYATQMNSWITAIHSAFPGAQVAAVAADANGVHGLSQRRRTWNADVLPLLKGEDAVTVHENLRVFDANSSPETVLAIPYLHFQQLKANELTLFRSHRLPVWITEFNMADMTPRHVFEGTWLHGLFVAEEALLFVSDPAIAYAGLNSTIGTARSAPIFDSANGFGAGGPATVPLARSAAGETLSIIQAAFHRAVSARPLNFPRGPELARTGAPALIGEALTTRSGQRELVMVNLSAHTVRLDLSAFFPHRYRASQVTAPSIGTRVTGPGSVKTRSSAAAGALAVEPYALADMSG